MRLLLLLLFVGVTFYAFNKKDEITDYVENKIDASKCILVKNKDYLPKALLDKVSSKDQLVCEIKNATNKAAKKTKEIFN